MYQDTRPIHNHPACLKMSNGKSPRSSPTDELDDDDVVVASLDDDKWWMNVLKQSEIDSLDAVENSSKMVALLHILAYSDKIGDKVLVFSQSLKTLDYVEHVLQLDNWKEHVTSLAAHFPEQKLGGWKAGTDFVRIDGTTASGRFHSVAFQIFFHIFFQLTFAFSVDPNPKGARGNIVDQFQDQAGSAKVFLIASIAGGIGINLHTANRVVLLDTHFNPSVAAQCLFRAYRYGQDKEVFCYRLLTEGTMEEKVYARSVNKSGVALRVIDGKTFNRCFSRSELDDLQKNNQWVQCDLCDKWRRL